MMIVIHILKGRLALCGFDATKLPSNGPPNHHTWTDMDDAESSNCVVCREKAGLKTTPEQWLGTIETFYAIIADDDAGEGVLGAPIGPGGTMMPLIATDKARLDCITLIVPRLAKYYNKKIRIVKFTSREVIQEIEP